MHSGLCYKTNVVTSPDGSTHNYMSFDLTLNENLISIPDSVQIIITSERNSNGIAMSSWGEGKTKI